jgi:hypothetical protein
LVALVALFADAHRMYARVLVRHLAEKLDVLLGVTLFTHLRSHVNISS